MTKHKRTTAVLATALTAALTLAGCGKDEEPQAQGTPSADVSTAETIEEKELTPGARIGVDQRTWPDPAGIYDDSAHAEVGQWSVDYYHQRPVWTPINFEGDLPKKDALKEGGFESCVSGDVALEGETQQQYVYGRYLAVNNQAGPSRMDDGVPAGFAHSPQGAVLFALNALGYGFANAGDEVGDAVDTKWWSTYEPLQEKKARYVDYDRSQIRAKMVAPPSFYNVAECSESVVVVEVGMDFTPSGDGTVATTLPLYWRNGEWVPDLTGAAGKRFDKGGTFDPENPAPLKAVRYE